MDSNVSPALPTDLIEPAQGAKMLGISGPTLWAWIRSGRLRAWRLDAARMGVSKAEVVAIIQPVVIPPPLPVRARRAKRMAKIVKENEERKAQRAMNGRVK
jgi:hypothetical protein